jgi:HlyD family secretion protein
LAAAQAAVTQAEQSLALKQKPYTDADILAQRQAVAAAEAALATKKTPYTDSDVLSAQAAVDQAKAALESAQLNLTNATLTAPFDGVVSSVAVNAGEASASPAVTIVDPKALRLDVTVDEADIAKVQSGQKAAITFDSIAGKSFTGQVTGVAPSATITSGVATYAVSISISEPDMIKAGMTGNATIVYGEQANALVVPNRAV